MDDNNYSIYKLTFPDGKIYIGQTGQEPELRWRDGEGYKTQEVYVPIILYGWKNIQREILHTNLSLQQANKLEKFYINKFHSDTEGYNKNQGGNNQGNGAGKPKTFIIEYADIDVKTFMSSYGLVALKQLSSVAFTLYVYLLKYNHQTIQLTNDKITQECGICKRSVSTAVDCLKTFGYLKEQSTGTFQFIPFL